MACLTHSLILIEVLTLLTNNTSPVHIYLVLVFALCTLGATLTGEAILTAGVTRLFVGEEGLRRTHVTLAPVFLISGKPRITFLTGVGILTVVAIGGA